HAGTLGDVLELVVPLVAVQSIGTDVRREVEIREPVAVDVTHGDAAAVVVVEEVDDVERGILLRHRIHERDAGGTGGQELEQRELRLATAAGHGAAARGRRRGPHKTIRTWGAPTWKEGLGTAHP